MLITNEDLNLALERLNRLVPKQGPIDIFIHHNTLQGFEDTPFHEAVCEVANKTNANVYMSPEFYRESLKTGRMSSSDLSHCSPAPLKATLQRLVAAPPSVDGQGTNEQAKSPRSTNATVDLLQHFLLQTFFHESIHTINWRLNHSVSEVPPSGPHLMALQLCRTEKQAAGVHGRKATPVGEHPRAAARAHLHELWQQVCSRTAGRFRNNPRPRWGVKTIDLTNTITYEFLTRYFDRGLSSWPMPKGELGLVDAFLTCQVSQDYRLPSFCREWDFEPQWLKAGVKSNDLILSLLAYLKVSKIGLDDFLLNLLEGAQGWASLVGFYEAKAHARVMVKDLIALRLLIFCGLQKNQGLTEIQEDSPTSLTIFYQIFDLLLAAGFTGTEVGALSESQWQELWDLCLHFDAWERLRILHAAYERHYYKKVGTALLKMKHNSRRQERAESTFSAVFCIDDREESMRRHLEELDGRCATYGYAGFFNIDMLFKGIGQDTPTALCPGNVNPVKLVEEHIVKKGGLGFSLAASVKALQRFLHMQSRTLTTGTLVHIFMPFFVVFADLIKMISPRLYLKSRSVLDKLPGSRVTTKVAIANLENTSSEASYYSYDELAERVANLLQTIGLANDLTPLIFIIGHGSTSLNNPHKSAYNCGACSGQRGAPNARVFAAAANHPAVRQRLAARGIELPDGVWFVGGIHDTCSDEVVFFDLDDIPTPQKADFARCQATFHLASQRDAQERARRFHSIPRSAGPHQALQAVQARAWEYRQPRPECGHATNALCIIGPRDLTRGLFLDRRAFLCCYDPTSDDDDAILVSLISAVVPVCAGINLEYYFSYVDNDKFGCGTKLPHNPTGLVGVMNGSLSDLQTGLPWQMVELHEPVRLLMIVECSLKRFVALRPRLPHVFSLVEGGWMHLALYENDSHTLTYLNGEILASSAEIDRVPRSSSSQEYVARQRHHLDPCMIG